MGRRPAAVGKAIEGNGPHPDGRRERSRSSRRRIIEAMMDLIAGGNINPSAANVAERAGVGLRTVFRHFDDKESIYREMNEILWQAYAPVIQAPFQSNDWREQLFELIERRASVYEEIAPFRIASSIQRFSSPVLMETYRRMIEQERANLERILPDHIRSDSDRARSILLATSFGSWRLFRHDEELSARETVDVIKQLLRDILDQIGS
ncbi:TetR/AcrR family transcriptional regulator [Tsuneonella mangrovi]|uniref:TetR/AcrR family transcriptional regulator n=1 Tax=Tsuneonella mangrovi TaxID=1982042 RepID=UPI000BA24C78|nr:TetR/AcrR family transcriptional regulator [Tsuneonella mangrovi]